MTQVFPKLSTKRKASELAKARALKKGNTSANVQSKTSRSVLETLKQIDIYGQAINLSYRGEQKFKTVPGALTSIWVIVILIAYIVYKSYILFNRINPNVDKKGLIRNLDIEDPFNPQDNGFDFSFGIKEPLDPSIGYYTVTENIQGYAPNSEGVWGPYKKKLDLEFAECGSDKSLFNHPNVTEIKMYGIDRLLCFKRKNYSL
jgi:hypothetical protein